MTDVRIPSIDNSAPPFTINEIKTAIFKFNKNKAPGIDNIDHYIVRQLFKNHQELLQDIYNILLKLNYFPTAWKRGELVFFLKSGKPPTEGDSYRPISLLPVLGKVFEKLILKRILNEIHNSSKLASSQHGFVPGKSTETAIQEVMSIINLNKQDGNYTYLVSLDFHHAFDNLPWDATMEELETMDIHKAYINITRSFLSLRSAFTNWLSQDLHWFDKGCPQGSCYGPFLWRIFVNKILKILKEKGYKVVAYADDLLLIISGSTRRKIEEDGNDALRLIQEWADNHNIHITHEKTTALQIKNPRRLKRPPTLRIYNKSITHNPTLKYLGLTLDSTLSFLPHLHGKRTEINILVQNLMKFAAPQHSISKSILKIWYNQILEKKVTYAVSTWFTKLQKSHGLILLSAIQAQCLLLVSRAYKKTATSALCVLTGIMPLALRAEKIAAQGAILRLGTPMIGINPDIYQPKYIPTDIIPYSTYFHWAENAEDRTRVQVYTDGSKTDTGVGYAFCIYDHQELIKEHQIHLGQSNSVYQAELLAIMDAISWLQTSTYKHATINSDSLSSLQALTDINTDNFIVGTIIKKLQQTTIKIYFHWVKGHSGVEGNEYADKLAKEATQQNTQIKQIFFPSPPSYLRGQLKQMFILKWQDQWTLEHRGRKAYNYCPKVSEEYLIPHRNIYLYVTNHGPFPSYLYLFGKAPSPYCTCGKRGDATHYILNCPLTSAYHIKKPTSVTYSAWFHHILNTPNLKQKLIECVHLLENNQQLFQMPPAHLMGNIHSSDEEE